MLRFAQHRSQLYTPMVYMYMTYVQPQESFHSVFTMAKLVYGTHQYIHLFYVQGNATCPETGPYVW